MRLAKVLRPATPLAARVLLALTMGAWLGAAPAGACTVPVFRYALERWPPDPHTVRVRLSVDAPLGMLGRDAHANAWLERADAVQSNDVRILFPESDLAWYEGAWRPDMAAALADSPLRRRLAHELAAGATAVWLFLDGTDAGASAARFAELESQLRDLEGSLKLPEEPAYDPVTPGWPGSQLQSQIPLNIRFTLHRLPVEMPGEEFLLRQVRAILGETAPVGAPRIVAVFGRGRAVPMSPEAPQTETVASFAEFICDECSCQVKMQNPGMDLLLTANWDEAVANYPEPATSTLAAGGTFRFGGTLAGPEPPGPLGPVAAGAAPPRPQTRATLPAQATAPESAKAAEPGSSDLTLRVLLVLAGLVILALAVLFVRKGSRR